MVRKKMTGGSTASIGKDKVGCVRADRQHHVACMETECGIRVGGQVVEKHVAGGVGFFCGCGLLVRDFVESGDDCRITSARVVEKGAGDLLDAPDAS